MTGSSRRGFLAGAVATGVASSVATQVAKAAPSERVALCVIGIRGRGSSLAKNFASLPPFVPVTFEFTVLLAAFGMVGTFLVVSDLKPYKWPRTFDIRSTDDKHVMAIDLATNKLSKDQISQILKENGAEEVNEKNF